MSMATRRNKDKEIEDLKARNEYLEKKSKIVTTWKDLTKGQRLFLSLILVKKSEYFLTFFPINNLFNPFLFSGLCLLPSISVTYTLLFIDENGASEQIGQPLYVNGHNGVFEWTSVVRCFIGKDGKHYFRRLQNTSTPEETV